MKKLYYLIFTLLTISTSFGQSSDLYFSMYGEGSSNNKFLEIYNGTGSNVDLSNYSVETYFNGSITPTSQALSGTLSDGDVYVIYNSSATITNIGSNGDLSLAGGVVNFNGDDAITLLKMGSIIDIIGQIGFDPGTAWNVGSTLGATANHTLVRKAEICDPNSIPANMAGNSFGTDDTNSEWLVYGQDLEWGQIGSHTGCSTTPSINITSPGNSSTFAPGTTSVNIEWSTANLGGGETVDITVNGSTTNNVTSPFAVATSNGQTYNITVELIDGGVVDSDMISFSVSDIINVFDLGALRSDVITNGIGRYYQIASNPTITYARVSRNQKYVQDATGGILIDDNAGTITTSFVAGDGMSGLVGQTVDFNGVLEFVPLQDASVVAGATITPEVITIASILANQEDYESELVRINGVSFTDAGMSFAASTNYDISDGSTTVFRTNFSEANYIGQTIPAGSNDMIVLVGEFNGTAQVTARSLSELTLSVENNRIDGFSFSPNPTSLGYVKITSKSQSIMTVGIYDILGKQVMSKTVENSRLDVSALTSGIYIMKISQVDATTTKKLVIR